MWPWSMDPLSRSANTSPVPSAACRSRTSSRATSPSTAPTGPAPNAQASEPGSRWIRSSSCPSPTGHSTTGRSHPGPAAVGRVTTSASSTPWPRSTESTPRRRGRHSGRRTAAPCSSAEVSAATRCPTRTASVGAAATRPPTRASSRGSSVSTSTRRATAPETGIANTCARSRVTPAAEHDSTRCRSPSPSVARTSLRCPRCPCSAPPPSSTAWPCRTGRRRSPSSSSRRSGPGSHSSWTSASTT